MTSEPAAGAVRTCLACRETLAKREMLRLVVDDEGHIWPDLMQKAPGRGTYLCMRPTCLQRMGDRRLASLKGKFPGVRTDWAALRQRIEKALQQQLQMTAMRLRSRACLGRDAVMHRMWNNAPLLILLACDAGQSLRRQVVDGARKRCDAAGRTTVLDVPGGNWLGDLFGRETLAVAGIDDSRQMAGWVKNCVWLGRLKESGYL